MFCSESRGSIDVQIIEISPSHISVYSTCLTMSAHGSLLQRFLFPTLPSGMFPVEKTAQWHYVVLTPRNESSLCLFWRCSLNQVSWPYASTCSPSSLSPPHSWGETASTVKHRLQPAEIKPFKSFPLITHFGRFSCLVTHFLSEVVCSCDWHLHFIPRIIMFFTAHFCGNMRENFFHSTVTDQLIN